MVSKATLGAFLGPEGAIAGKMLDVMEKKNTPAPAPAPTVVQAPAAPIHNEPATPIGEMLKEVSLLGFALLIIFAVLYKLGLQTWANTLGILLVVLLAILYRASPKVMGTVFTVLGFAAFGIGGFVLLAMLPGKSTYIFTSIFIIFYVVTLFAVIGARALPVLCIIMLTVGLSAIYYPALFISGSPIYNAVVGQQQSWNDLVKGTQTFANATQQSFARQLAVATGDQSYEQGVEAQSQKPLGVFLDSIGVTADRVTQGQPIDAFATLRAESFKTDTPVVIQLACNSGKVTGDVKPQSQFTVEEYDQQSIDCLLASEQIGEGSAPIAIDASFTFSTSAFLKAYFMDQETIRSYRRQQLDPLDDFKITDKNPVAVFTGGPLKIGMGVGTEPISLIQGSDAGPTLVITFERNWPDGQIVAMNDVTIIAPPGITINSVNLKPVDSMCTGGGESEQTCKLSEAMLSSIFTKDQLQSAFTNLRVQTKVSSITAILGQAPLGIRSFKVNANYKYQIEKTTSVTILRVPATTSAVNP